MERRGFQQLFGEVSMRNSRRLHTLHSTDDRQMRPDAVSIRSRFEMDMPSFLPNTSPEVPNFFLCRLPWRFVASDSGSLAKIWKISLLMPSEDSGSWDGET